MRMICGAAITLFALSAHAQDLKYDPNARVREMARANAEDGARRCFRTASAIQLGQGVRDSQKIIQGSLNYCAGILSYVVAVNGADHKDETMAMIYVWAGEELNSVPGVSR